LLVAVKKRVLKEDLHLGGHIMKKPKGQYIVNEKGEKTAVVLPVEEYLELLEDLHDLAVIAERRDEPTSTFDELKKRLRKDGLL
jgi:hypothetical protein